MWRTMPCVTLAPSQLRSTDSSTMRMDTGKRCTSTPRALPRGRQRIELTGFLADLESLESVERIVRHDGLRDVTA